MITESLSDELRHAINTYTAVTHFAVYKNMERNGVEFFMCYVRW